MGNIQFKVGNISVFNVSESLIKKYGDIKSVFALYGVKLSIFIFFLLSALEISFKFNSYSDIFSYIGYLSIVLVFFMLFFATKKKLLDGKFTLLVCAGFFLVLFSFVLNPSRESLSNLKDLIPINSIFGLLLLLYAERIATSKKVFYSVFAILAAVSYLIVGFDFYSILYRAIIEKASLDTTALNFQYYILAIAVEYYVLKSNFDFKLKIVNLLFLWITLFVFALTIDNLRLWYVSIAIVLVIAYYIYTNISEVKNFVKNVLNHMRNSNLRPIAFDLVLILVSFLFFAFGIFLVWNQLQITTLVSQYNKLGLFDNFSIYNVISSLSFTTSNTFSEYLMKNYGLAVLVAIFAALVSPIIISIKNKLPNMEAYFFVILLATIMLFFDTFSYFYLVIILFVDYLIFLKIDGKSKVKA